MTTNIDPISFAVSVDAVFLLEMTEEQIQRTGEIIMNKVRTEQAKRLCARDGHIPLTQRHGELLPEFLQGEFCARCRKILDVGRWDRRLAELDRQYRIAPADL